MQNKKLPSIFDGRTSMYDNFTGGKEQKTKREFLKIVNNEPLDFEEIIDTSYSSTTKLSMQINEIFKPLFSDWYGCDIIPDPESGSFIVSFIFKAVATGDDENRAFLPITNKKQKTSNSTLDRILQINRINSSAQTNMEITPYGMELIYDLIYDNLKKNINPEKPSTYKNIVAETVENTGIGMYSGQTQNIYNTVVGIDIKKVLAILFGNKTKDGKDYYAYNIFAINIAPNNFNTNRVNYILEIQRCPYNKGQQTVAELSGRMNAPGAISAVTETMSKM